ncbi:hypothetical protein E1A91_D04G102000v1 [Gossypium mustelinum]|uniref:XPG N-terminal domain-containing protein n=1 Tax=Gossypium mustelinum TaxID=34275 RepID=A0A5D2VC27_GOSMU|nr:hypothetical protein E1A91_D04G102000v1 [Gossypium mustelinum]
MFTRIIRLLEAGFKPVYVFDGQPPDLKKQELVTQRGLMLLRICKKPWRYFFLVTHGVISKVFFCCLTTTEN